MRYAKLHHQACVEDVVYHTPRGLGPALFVKLSQCLWIKDHENLLICGKSGAGKSWLACALGHQACRDNYSVLYRRVPKLFAELMLARGAGRYARRLRSLSVVQAPIVDDFGLAAVDGVARHDLLEILEERYGRRSTIITSQLPVDHRHDLIGGPTYADAILDCIVHNAYRIDFSGSSLRKERKSPVRSNKRPS